MYQTIKNCIPLLALIFITVSVQQCSRRQSDFLTDPSKISDKSSLRPLTSLDSSILNNYKEIDFIYESIDHLFGTFATPDMGLVAYDSLWQNSLFHHLKDSIINFNLGLLSTRTDSFAFFINAYNIMVIDLLQANVTANGKVDLSMFSQPIKVAGNLITLDILEKHDTYVKKFNDPRSHFVLNCAAASCPPLLNRAYRGNTLWEDLDYKTKTFIRNSDFNPLNVDPPQISMLFHETWFKNDFSGYKRDIASVSRLSSLANGTEFDFIDSYLEDGNKRTYLRSSNLGYMDYNWEINSQ